LPELNLPWKSPQIGLQENKLFKKIRCDDPTMPEDDGWGNYKLNTEFRGRGIFAFALPASRGGGSQAVSAPSRIRQTKTCCG
jgi:hypothetical protein